MDVFSAPSFLYAVVSFADRAAPTTAAAAMTTGGKEDPAAAVPPRKYNKHPDISEVTVMVKNAVKTYGGGHAVLGGLDMTVAKGEM